MQAVHAAINRGLLRSCHDLSEGGLAVALAEMAFAGGLGAHGDAGRCSPRRGRLERSCATFLGITDVGSWSKLGPSASSELAALWNGVPFCRLGEVTWAVRARATCLAAIDRAWMWRLDR